MLKLRTLVVTSIVLFVLSPAFAANTVTVDSKTVCTGQKDVTVKVKLVNDRELRHITIPLEVRSVKGGAYVSALRLSWGDRMPVGREEPLGENPFTNQYYVRDCPCGKNKVQGYATIAHADTLKHEIESSPTGILFSRFRMMGKNLLPGADETGSIVMTFDIGSKPGVFEIDTTCICPSHNLMFVESALGPLPIYPKFDKGVITVEACK
jgi:hypothetical protein